MSDNAQEMTQDKINNVRKTVAGNGWTDMEDVIDFAERALRAADPAPALFDPAFQERNSKLVADMPDWKKGSPVNERKPEPAPAEGAPWRSDKSAYVFEGDVLKFIVQTGASSVKEAARIVSLLNRAPGAAPAPCPVTPQRIREIVTDCINTLVGLGVSKTLAESPRQFSELLLLADWMEQKQ